jgi:hypothetical protein
MWVCFLRERERECVCLFGKPNGIIFARIVYYLFRTSKDFSLSRALQGRNNRHLEREKIFGDCFDGSFFFLDCAVRPNGPWHHKTANRNVHNAETK